MIDVKYFYRISEIQYTFKWFSYVCMLFHLKSGFWIFHSFAFLLLEWFEQYNAINYHKKTHKKKVKTLNSIVAIDWFLLRNYESTIIYSSFLFRNDKFGEYE